MFTSSVVSLASVVSFRWFPFVFSGFSTRLEIYRVAAVAERNDDLGVRGDQNNVRFVAAVKNDPVGCSRWRYECGSFRQRSVRKLVGSRIRKRSTKSTEYSDRIEIQTKENF